MPRILNPACATGRYSTFCHICGKIATKDRLECSSDLKRKCKKVIHKACLEKHNLESYNGSRWNCTHCRGICPRAATCNTYEKTNARLKISTQDEVDSGRATGGSANLEIQPEPEPEPNVQDFADDIDESLPQPQTPCADETGEPQSQPQTTRIPGTEEEVLSALFKIYENEERTDHSSCEESYFG